MGNEKSGGRRGSKLKPCCDAARLLLDRVQKDGLRGTARTLEIDPARLSRLITGANIPTYEERKRLSERCQIEPCQWDDDAQGKKTAVYVKIPLREISKHLSGVSDQSLFVLGVLDDSVVRIDCALACMRRLPIMYDEMVAICEVVGKLYSPSSAVEFCREPVLTLSTWMSGLIGNQVARKYSIAPKEWRRLIGKFGKDDVLARAAFDLAVEYRRGGAYIRKVFDRTRRLGKDVDRESTPDRKGHK